MLSGRIFWMKFLLVLVHQSHNLLTISWVNGVFFVFFKIFNLNNTHYNYAINIFTVLRCKVKNKNKMKETSVKNYKINTRFKKFGQCLSLLKRN